jgi:NAD(P)-dependent dehydrogenase (short-subunit alcohol dehydrogenase family)
MDLKDKTVLITGSSKGIGEALSYAFSKEGAKVIITYNSDQEGAQKIEEKCRELGAVDTLIIPLDVSKNESIENAQSQVEEKMGHIDILVNNAGVISWERFAQESFEEIEKQVGVNLEGVIKMTLAFMPMIKEGIINISSRAGHIPYPGRATYCATKFGVIGFTKSIALEYPDLKIFTVSPGATKTEMWDFESGADPEKVAELVVKTWKGEIPLKDGDLPIWEMI